jgi:hypothetical protein
MVFNIKHFDIPCLRRIWKAARPGFSVGTALGDPPDRRTLREQADDTGRVIASGPATRSILLTGAFIADQPPVRLPSERIRPGRWPVAPAIRRPAVALALGVSTRVRVIRTPGAP